MSNACPTCNSEFGKISGVCPTCNFDYSGAKSALGMSETPRTDVSVANFGYLPFDLTKEGIIQTADAADMRQLEHELTAAQNRIAEMEAPQVPAFVLEYDQMRQQLAAYQNAKMPEEPERKRFTINIGGIPTTLDGTWISEEQYDALARYCARLTVELEAAEKDETVLNWIATVAPLTVAAWREQFAPHAAAAGKEKAE